MNQQNNQLDQNFKEKIALRGQETKNDLKTFVTDKLTNSGCKCQRNLNLLQILGTIVIYFPGQRNHFINITSKSGAIAIPARMSNDDLFSEKKTFFCSINDHNLIITHKIAEKQIFVSENGVVGDKEYVVEDLKERFRTPLILRKEDQKHLIGKLMNSIEDIDNPDDPTSSDKEKIRELRIILNHQEEIRNILRSKCSHTLQSFDLVLEQSFEHGVAQELNFSDGMILTWLEMRPAIKDKRAVKSSSFNVELAFDYNAKVTIDFNTKGDSLDL